MSVVAIVGASVGGVRTAKMLRSIGYQDRIVLIGDEPIEPYDKPSLSKGVLAGVRQPDVLLTRDAADEAGIELLLGHAARHLDLRDRLVVLDDGSSLPYDDVVLATGSRARPVPWSTPPGVQVLRTLDDSQRLREQLLRGGALAVIGAGFIGAEVAATAHGLGIDEITLIDPEPYPMSRAIDPGIAERVTSMYARRGLNLRFGIGVLGIDQRGSGLEIALSDDTTLPVAAAVVGIGALPNDAWLADSGLEIDNGVRCDEYSRCVGPEHVYAVGDVARWWSVRESRAKRVEHWTNAVEQASCVAHNIFNKNDLRVHDPIEYVWSDQFDWKIQTVGHTGGSPDLLLENESRADSFAALHSDDHGQLSGAVIVNWPKALITCRRALSEATQMRDTTDALARIQEAAPPA